MARTQEAANLTEQHRQAQLTIRARALRDFAVIWPLWHQNDPQTFPSLVAASTTLVRTYRQISAAAAAAFFTSFRAAEDVAGNFSPSLASAIPEEQVAASLYVTGERAARDALRAGRRPDDVRAIAFTRTSGAVSRHILNGGRQTILDSVDRDRHARGWARVTDGDPCAFCLVLASRGVVYKSEQAADFEAHDHCGCTAEPFYDGSEPPRADDFLKTYDAAQRWGVEQGLLQPGPNGSSARVNAVRRYLAAR